MAPLMITPPIEVLEQYLPKSPYSQTIILSVLLGLILAAIGGVIYIFTFLKSMKPHY